MNSLSGNKFTWDFYRAHAYGDFPSLNYPLRLTENAAIGHVGTAVSTSLDIVAEYGPESWQGTARRLGSRLIDRQSQNRTVAARAMAERKTFGHLS